MSYHFKEDHTMDIQYLADKKTVKEGGLVLIFSIVALLLPILYICVVFSSFFFAIIPIPILGLLISIGLSFIEIALLLAAIGFGVFSLVRACILMKRYKALPDNEEKRKALVCVKIALILSIIGLAVIHFVAIGASFLNLFEIVLALV